MLTFGSGSRAKALMQAVGRSCSVIEFKPDGTIVSSVSARADGKSGSRLPPAHDDGRARPALRFVASRAQAAG